MSNFLTDTEEINRTLELFHDELDRGVRLVQLPLRVIDWNGNAGMKFLQERCRRGAGEEIVKKLERFHLKDKNLKSILCVAVQKGVPMDSLPLRDTFTGGKSSCKELWDIIAAEKKVRVKEYLDELRYDRATHCEAKKEAYDYIVSELKRQKIATFPDSKVVFGVLHEEEEKRANPKEDIRKRIITNDRMTNLALELGAHGIGAMKELWSAVTGLGELKYVNVDDVSAHPLFIEKLTKVVGDAVKKGFEETFKCVRAIPLLYGGEEIGFDDTVPEVVDKAFKKYPMLLKAIEVIYLDEDMTQQERLDYFFFAKLAAANPDFNLMDINLARLPEEVTLFSESGASFNLPLQQQLEAIVETAVHARVADMAKQDGVDEAVVQISAAEERIPEAFTSYHFHPGKGGVLTVLHQWNEAKKKAALGRKEAVKPKKSLLGRLLAGIFGKK